MRHDINQYNVLFLLTWGDKASPWLQTVNLEETVVRQCLFWYYRPTDKILWGATIIHICTIRRSGHKQKGISCITQFSAMLHDNTLSLLSLLLDQLHLQILQIDHQTVVHLKYSFVVHNFINRHHCKLVCTSQGWCNPSLILNWTSNNYCN